MNKEEYRKYLRSDHWKELRGRKQKKCRKSKDGRLRCSICASTEKLQTHHLQYRNIYDVLTSDLRILCGRCYELVHKLMQAGKIKKSSSHHGMFGIIKAAVKKELGLTGRNLFREEDERNGQE